jgi:hypothetical protein
LWEDVRRALKHQDVARLIGLLSHLIHWIVFMPARMEGPQLSESALQSLFVAIHENWADFEKSYRDTKAGVGFVLPCLMLTIKRGIERSFEISYPTFMSDEMLHQLVLDRINTLLMRLFDPDGTYSRFGKFDGEGKAITLSKKLGVMMASEGNTYTKRLHGRLHRATPLVRAVLGLTGTVEHGGTVADAKTRVMMLHSDNGGTVLSGGVVDPPQDKDRQSALLTAALARLPFKSQYSLCTGQGLGSSKQPASARQPKRELGTKVPSPRSARGGGAAARGGGGGGGIGTALGTANVSPGMSGSGVGGGAGPVSASSTDRGLTAWAGAGVHNAGSNERAPGSAKVQDRMKLPSLPRPARKVPM